MKAERIDGDELVAAHARCELLAEETMKAANASAELARLCYEGQRRAREAGELVLKLTRELARAENTIDGLRADLRRLTAPQVESPKVSGRDGLRWLVGNREADLDALGVELAEICRRRDAEELTDAEATRMMHAAQDAWKKRHGGGA